MAKNLIFISGAVIFVILIDIFICCSTTIGTAELNGVCQLEQKITEINAANCVRETETIFKEPANKTGNDDVVVLTIATNETDGFVRYMRSARVYDIKPQVIGLGTTWRGGNVKKYAAGGHKVNMLRPELEKYKHDSNRIIIFTDSYDVIFLSNIDDIVTKFLAMDARVVFSAESVCWPDKKLAEKYPPVYKGKRYLNSGMFIGYAPEIYKIVTHSFIEDLDDDQLYYTNIYLDEKLRNEFKIKLDSTSEIFQNLYGAITDVQLKFEDNEAYLENVAYKTKPLVLHGNGLSKPLLNSLSNYLAQTWKPNEQCIACWEDNIHLDKIKVAKYPTVLVSLFIEQPTPFLEEFLEKIQLLEYPKKKMHLFIRNTVKYHSEVVSNFVKEYGSEYVSVKEVTPDDDISDWKARNLALDHCLEKKCDYYLNVDSIAHLDNPHTLKLLIEQNRTIVAPLVVRTGKAWSNFWGALTTDGFYARSSDYMHIVNNDRRGLWNVPFISSCYLINATLLRQYDRKQLGYVSDNLDFDMAFCANLRELDVFMYVSNRIDFGHLVNPDTYDTTRTAPEMYQIFENRYDWERRYIHENFTENFNPNNTPAQPCPDVYWFPIVSLRFCNDLIQMMEAFGQWSDGKNNDPRLDGGYEAVPTRDIHMNQVGWERHWLYFLKEFVRPLQEHVFTGYFHDPPRSLMNFVVRYRPDEQPFLRPHHDSSTYTINIALNKRGVDYEGGGCKFIRYNCSVVDTRPGWLLMHPGRLTHYHEGLTVTKGTRYIMIAFVDP